MKKQVLSDVKNGGRFTYGGVEWIKLDQVGREVVAIAAEPVFGRAFDEGDRNDWRKSSLRQELNGAFIDALIANGADQAAFKEFESDLVADNGATNCGTALDKIALITCDLYREYRTLIPKIERWWWTLTPWACDPGYLCNVRIVNSSGAIGWNYTNSGDGDVRPLCHLESSIFVGDEDHVEMINHGEFIGKAHDEVIDVLNDYPKYLWGSIIGRVVETVSKLLLPEE